MRTNIDLDDTLLARAWQHARGHTKRALVHEALELFVRVKEREQALHAYDEGVKAVWELSAKYSSRTNSQDLIREDRDCLVS